MSFNANAPLPGKASQDTLDGISVRLLNRDFTLNRYTLGLVFKPVGFSVDVIGGYDAAEIEVDGPIEALFALTQMLRCGIELYDHSGQTIWQGLIKSVELPWGQRIIGRSLDEAANTVQVAYNRPEGTVGRTAWATNARHIARYGTKQLVGSLTDATDAQALAYRDTLLAARSIWPAPKIVSRRGRGQNTGRILCIGFYRTLDWQYYSNPDMGLSRIPDSTSDIADVVWSDKYDLVEDQTVQFGDATSSSQAYFWFTCNATNPLPLNRVEFKLVRVGSPADNFIVDLVLDNAGVPGTVLETVTIAASTLATSHTWQSFGFKSIVLPGVVYGFLLRRSGAVSGSNYFRAASHSALGYTNGATRVNNAGTWTTQTSDVLFHLEAKGPPLIDIAAVAGRSSYAQKFTLDNASASYGIVGVTVTAARVGTPGGDFRIQVWSDSAGLPGSVIGVATVPAALLATVTSDVTVSFGVGQVTAVAPSTPLWIAVSRLGGGVDAANYYLVKAVASTPAFTLDNKHYNGTSWVALSTYRWMPYTVTYGVESTEQIKRIVTACGPFFSALDLRVSSGVFVPAYASGDSTALNLIHELLVGGTATGGRMNARVTTDRRLQIYAEAVLDDDAWYEAEDGTMRTRFGTEVPDDMTVGVWLVPQNLPGGEVATDWAQFIERADWKGGTQSAGTAQSSGTITRTARDTKDAFDAFGVQRR